MSLGNFKTRLLREAKKDPKKAVALGLLGLVAAYFWGPILWPAGSEGSDSQPTTIASSPQVASVADINRFNVQTRQATAPAKHSWQTLNQWMAEDPLMSSTPTAWTGRDPFVSPKSKTLAETELASAALKQPRRAEVTPQEAGLELHSTAVGRQRRVALIDGRAYAEGSEITREVGGDTITFKLAEVRPRRIVLVRNNARYELEIEDTNLTDSVRLQRAP